MSIEYREVRSQEGLEAALAAEGVVPVCVGDGYFFIPASSGSASVEASGSASVRAYDSASVEATKYVAIHNHNRDTTIHGGVIIHLPDWDTATPTDWADYTGLTLTDDGTITVYKAVDANLTSGHGTTYPPGETVTAPDWNPVRDCGEGLHFSQTPRHARRYHGHDDTARFLACQICVDETVVLGHDKVKAKSCLVLHEVDLDGEPLPEQATDDAAARTEAVTS